MLRVALWLFAGLWAAYLIAANAFLNLNLLPMAFASTNQVKATIAGGWSVLPGRVHVKQARVTFQDHNVQFSIDMARGFVVLELRELLKRTFHASQLRGEGVAFRMRNRVDPESKSEPWVSTLPPIPEFPAPAVYEAYVPEAPLSDAEYNLWTIHFDDVDVGVSEIWSMSFRYTGKGRARGKFLLHPARSLWVGPATLDLEPGLLSAGAYRIAPGLHGHIDCTVHPFDVRPVTGLEPLRFISMHVRLDASSLDPQFYALFAGEPAPKVSSVGGSLHLDVETKHGVFTDPSRLDIVQKNFELRTGPGDLDAEQLEVHAGIENDGSFATVLVDRGRFKEPIAPGHPPRIDHLALTVVSSNRDSSKAFDFKEARLSEARLMLGDSTWLNRWVKGRNFELSGGGVSLVAHGRYAEQRVNGDAVLESDGVEGRVAGKLVRYAGALTLHGEQVDPVQFTGNASAELSGRSLYANLGDGEFRVAGLRAQASMQRDASGNIAHAEAVISGFSSKTSVVTLQAPQLTAVADSQQAGDGAQVTRFSAKIPAFSAEGRGVRLTTGAACHGTFAQPKNKAEKQLELWATLLAPRATIGENPVKTAVTKSVQVHASLTSDAADALSGKLALAPAAWRVDAGNMRFSGQSALDAQLSALDLARNSGQVEARLVSTGVTLGDTTQNAACPWSRVQTLTLDGTARLLERGAASLAMTGELAQTELNWGDFLTRGDVGVSARFEQGVVAGEGDGALDLKIVNANLRSGSGGDKGWAASVPALDLQARLERRAGQITGTAQVGAPRASGRIGATRLSTDFSADFKVDSLDLAARTAHGSGAVHVRNAALPNVADPVSKWWADVKLDSVYGHAEESLELGGSFRADLRDATPGLAVLAAQGSLPKWVASAFPLRGLTVTGSMARRCRLTDIHLVQLSGGPAVARGRLQSLPDGFQGALLLRVAGLSVVSAGLDFDANHTHFGLFDGDDWLARFNQSFDRKSDNAVKLACPPDEGNMCTDPQANVVTSSQ